MIYYFFKMMNRALALSPLDGRYQKKCQILSAYFSEGGYTKYRLQIEIEYFIILSQTKDQAFIDFLRNLYRDPSPQTFEEIFKIEDKINHDVKSVEYFIRNKIIEFNTEKEELCSFVHFGLTSQDISTTALWLQLKHSQEEIMMPVLNELINSLNLIASTHIDTVMLSRTHGQPASPTTFGKEIYVFIERLKGQREQLYNIPYKTKMGGAIGNMNAHYIALPDVDWVQFMNKFVKSLGLERYQYTTQIGHYDNMGAIFDGWKRINTILIDLCRDIWMYISMRYIQLKPDKNHVGSSTMPHKINPIDFENAEGNLGIANALFSFFSQKLPISRLQRDLSDSTVVRNIGVGFGHTLISLKSILAGLKKSEPNPKIMKQDLQDNFVVIAEAVQTILKVEGVSNAYELVKEFTRTNEKIDKSAFMYWIAILDIDERIKDRLRKLEPISYIGNVHPNKC